MEQYVCFNGKMVNETEFSLSAYNRGFYYGDSIFESMHAHSTTIPLFKLHYDRIIQGIEVLGYEPPIHFTAPDIEALITKLLNKNKLFKSTRVRLTVFRNEGGLYTPTNNKASFLIQALPLAFEKLEHKLPSMIVDVFPNQIKCAGELSPFKTGNALLYIQAARYAKQKGLHDCIITNQHGRYVELSSSNIFGIKGNTLVTPPLQEGCVAGVMRSVIIGKLAEIAGYSVEIKPIQAKDFADFDEAFGTNAITGIRNIVGVGTKRFYSTKYRKLRALLEELLFE